MPRAGQATRRPCRAAAAGRGKKTEKRQLQKTAGRYLFRSPSRPHQTKHPQGRGEAPRCKPLMPIPIETPPRTWGRLDGRGKGAELARNTPTNVGKTARCKPYGLSFRGKNAAFPLAFGRAALRRLAFNLFQRRNALKRAGGGGFSPLPPALQQSETPYSCCWRMSRMVRMRSCVVRD